jgi:hypothetical protein
MNGVYLDTQFIVRDLETQHVCAHFLPQAPDRVADTFTTDSTTRTFRAREGTLLRVWKRSNDSTVNIAGALPNAKGRAFSVSTQRKADAFTSKWASQRSFGDAFVEALGEDYKKLDTLIEADFTYYFLLVNNDENCIVVLNDALSVYYIGRMSIVNGELVFDVDTPLGVGLRPVEYSTSSGDEAIGTSQDARPERSTAPEGVWKITTTGGVHIERIIPSAYAQALALRGSEPDLVVRLIQLIKSGPDGNPWVNEFLTRYNRFIGPTYQALVNETKDLLDFYTRRYRKKEQLRVSHVEHRILVEAHKLFYARISEPQTSPTPRAYAQVVDGEARPPRRKYRRGARVSITLKDISELVRQQEPHVIVELISERLTRDQIE